VNIIKVNKLVHLAVPAPQDEAVVVKSPKNDLQANPSSSHDMADYCSTLYKDHDSGDVEQRMMANRIIKGTYKPSILQK
jgi:hypothetical protein